MSQLTRLEILEAIVAEGNITAASEKLYVSQPYLSKLVKQIEDEIGTLLFERLPRAMQITFAGERYMEYLKRIAMLEQDLSAEMDMIAKNKKGKIKLGINPALGTILLPKILPVFVENHPNIEIELHEDDAHTLEYKLINNVIDLALGMTPIKSPQLTYEFIYEDRMHLLVSNQSPLYNETYKGIVPFPYKLATMSDLPLILLSPKYGLRRLVDEFYEKNRLRQNIKLQTSTIYTAIGLVRKGMGSTFVPVTGMSWVDFRNCNLFLLDNDILKSNFVVFYKKDRMISPSITSFIDVTKQTLSEESQHFFISEPS